MRKVGLSFLYAFRGIASAFSGQRNIKIQMCFGVAAVAAGLFLRVPKLELMAIIIIYGMIIALEMVNTAVEKMVDILSPEYNKNYGVIKDIMAGAVLVLAITSVILGVMIFLPPLLEFIK